MQELKERLTRVADIIARENERLKSGDIAGFVAYEPHHLLRVVLATLPHVPPGARSIDLGAGTGAWWLLMAAAGVPSYAIEIDPTLVESARASYARCVALELIGRDVPCVIALGDMIPEEERDGYRRFVDAHGEVARNMPILDGPDAYGAIGSPLSGFGVIYCWAWPAQSRFIFNMLARQASPDALLVLPAYVRYTQGEHMNASMRERNDLLLDIIATVSETVIGRKTQDAPKE